MGITEQTLYRWKKQYRGLETDQIRQHLAAAQSEVAALARALDLCRD